MIMWTGWSQGTAGGLPTPRLSVPTHYTCKPWLRCCVVARQYEWIRRNGVTVVHAAYVTPINPANWTTDYPDNDGDDDGRWGNTKVFPGAAQTLAMYRYTLASVISQPHEHNRFDYSQRKLNDRCRVKPTGRDRDIWNAVENAYLLSS